MANYIVTDTELTSIADAIRSKAGTSDSMVFPSGFVSGIESIEAGGSSGLVDFMAERTLSEAIGHSARTIASYAFASCGPLTMASFPAATSIGSYAFAYCSSLTEVNFPSVTSIETDAFAYCSSLTEVNFPAVTRIEVSAFEHCESISTASFPSATYIGRNAFGFCISLTMASFPAVTSIGAYAFYQCSSISTASFPHAIYIGSSAFYNCTNLSHLYLLASEYCTMPSTALRSTPIATTGSFGSIYVPSSMLSSYKTRAGFSNYAARLVGV